MYNSYQYDVEKNSLSITLLPHVRCSQKARRHPSTWSESERAALEGAVRLAQFSDSTIQLTEIDVVTKQEVEVRTRVYIT